MCKNPMALREEEASNQKGPFQGGWATVLNAVKRLPPQYSSFTFAVEP